MMKIINLTPHDIVVKSAGTTITYEKSCMVARIATKENYLQDIQGIPAVQTQYLNLSGIPDQGGTFIVSSLVLDYIKKSECLIRDDQIFVAPDTGKSAERDNQGRITSVKQWKI